MEIDHILLAVADLDGAGTEFEVHHALSSIEGGRHAAWGTANRIVPLGNSYLELVTVVDPTRASESTFGRWVASAASGPARPLGWAVRTSRLDEVARRLDLAVHVGSRTTPGGVELRWRTAGIDEAAAEPSIPFFIEWAHGTRLPGQAAIQHRAGTATISRVDIEADPGRLARWLGDQKLPIEVRQGKAGVTSITVLSDAGEIVIGSGE